MKNLSILILLLFVFLFQGFVEDYSLAKVSTADTFASDTMTSDLSIEIHGLDSDEGVVMIAVYASEGQWLSKSQFSKSSDIVNGVATVHFKNIPLGTYAVSTYHDQNGNKKLDKGLFGIPSEPYASSRGAKGRFGPPKWKDAKFEIKNSSHTEEIKY